MRDFLLEFEIGGFGCGGDFYGIKLKGKYGGMIACGVCFFYFFYVAISCLILSLFYIYFASFPVNFLYLCLVFLFLQLQVFGFLLFSTSTLLMINCQLPVNVHVFGDACSCASL
ncbi:hypothetical protein DFH27DRAFT_246641 [Peziza echinospora]|nr:hypothetical protein DFH27DRAFT_246641 [Peziza echinospora]